MPIILWGGLLEGNPLLVTIGFDHTKLLIGLLIVCLPVTLAAQNNLHDVTGAVRDPEGLAVPAANVQLFGPNRVLLAETSTNEWGEFALEGLAPGSYELRIETPTFAPARRILTVPLPEGDRLMISLALNPVQTQVTVTASHGAPEETLYEPAAITVHDAQELLSREVSHLPRMLAEQPGVLTQETTPGQGSPVLRGQGAQTVLYLLDGIRFNNSTYRSGNTQYLGWIPSASTDAVEVLLGPAGTQYGSDALGGAVNIMTSPLPSWGDDGLRWHGESRTFFRSSDLGGGSAVQTSVAGRRLAFSLGGSFARSQNLRTGGGRDSHNSLIRFLGFSAPQVKEVLGNRLRDTAFTQGSWHAKLGARFEGDHLLTLSWLQSEQWGVRRYDRLLGGEGRLRSDFVPQRLRFGYLRYQKISAGRLQSLTATVSLNQQIDGQLSQTRESSDLRNERNRVTALGYVLSTAWRPAQSHSVNAGVEFFDEFVAARRFETEPGGPATEVRPRFPNGSRYRSLGLYLSDDWKPLGDRLVLDSGLRLSHFRFQSRSNRNVFVNGEPTVPDAKQIFNDLTFHSGFAYSPAKSLVVVGRVARGFRAPTVFDLGQLGLSGGGFEVSPDETLGFGSVVGDSAGSAAISTGKTWQKLEPEVLWSFEGGLRWRTERVTGSLNLFDSEFFDSIQRRTLIVPAPVVGETIGGETITAQDAEGRIFVDLDPRPVISRANIGRIRIYGVETGTRVNWTEQWGSSLKASFQRGRELNTRNFARRIAPANFFGSLRWNSRGGLFWLEIFTEISAAHTRLNPAEVNDPRVGAFRTAETIEDFFDYTAQRLGLVQNGILQVTGETLDQVIARVLAGTPAGAPLFTRTQGFATLNLRGSYRVNEQGELFFSLSNLTDENYRRHGSGFDSPGASLSLSYRLRFH